MGGTLTLLIRHLVRQDVDGGGRRIAVLYGVNTAGAALGAFLTDFALVPSIGLRGTQMVAVVLNLVAGIGALVDRASRTSGQPRKVGKQAVGPASDQAAGLPRTGRTQRLDQPDRDAHDAVASALTERPAGRNAALALTSLALAMSGFAAMGMEILWFRHLTILLGQWRAVFSLLLTVILVGTGAGSLLVRLRASPNGRVGGCRRSEAAKTLMVVQALFVAFTLLGLALADAARDRGHRQGRSDVPGIRRPGRRRGARRARRTGAHVHRAVVQRQTDPARGRPARAADGLQFSARQRDHPACASSLVGRRAGVLYLSNTVGAVCGSLAAGFLLLPALGIQAQRRALLTIGRGSRSCRSYFVRLASTSRPRTTSNPAGLRHSTPDRTGACHRLRPAHRRSRDRVVVPAAVRLRPDRGRWRARTNGADCSRCAKA